MISIITIGCTEELPPPPHENQSQLDPPPSGMDLDTFEVFVEFDANNSDNTEE